MRFVKYLTETGQITMVGIVASEADLRIQPTAEGEGIHVSPFADPDLHFVQNGETVDRPVLPVTVSKRKIRADNIDEAVLEGFPAGARVSIDGTEYLVGTGVLSLTSPMPATYHLTCSHFPFLEWETSIEAVAG